MGLHRPRRRTSATLLCPPIIPCPICHLRQWLQPQPQPPLWPALLTRRNTNSPTKAWWAMAASMDTPIACLVPNSLETQNRKTRNGGGKLFSSKMSSSLMRMCFAGFVALSSASAYSKKGHLRFSNPIIRWSQCGAVWFEYLCCQFSVNENEEKNNDERKQPPIHTRNKKDIDIEVDIRVKLLSTWIVVNVDRGLAHATAAVRAQY